jgi:hypothetical protein
MVSLTIGLLLLTNLHANTDLVTLWIWMAIAGAGIGPAFAVFTLIVSAAVPMRQIGVASSSLTFFQQIGGTIGLTIASTLFASRLTEEVPRQLVAAGVPEQFVGQFAGNSGSFNLTGTGDLGARILEQVPAEFKALVEPLIPSIVNGIHEAISLALGGAVWVGVGAAILAVIAVLFLKEVPLRSSWDEGPPPEAEPIPGALEAHVPAAEPE